MALGAHYSISYTDWNWEMGLDGEMMGDGEIFDNPDYGYFMFFVITPDDGYTFAENTVIMVNGNPSLVGPKSRAPTSWTTFAPSASGVRHCRRSPRFRTWR